MGRGHAQPLGVVGHRAQHASRAHRPPGARGDLDEQAAQGCSGLGQDGQGRRRRQHRGARG
eukprot:4553624-Prymnesium_polylepis.1